MPVVLQSEFVLGLEEILKGFVYLLRSKVLVGPDIGEQDMAGLARVEPRVRWASSVQAVVDEFDVVDIRDVSLGKARQIGLGGLSRDFVVCVVGLLGHLMLACVMLVA